MARPEITGKKVGRTHSGGAGPHIRILSYDDLKSKGIRFSRQWIDQLIARGEFPRKVYIGEATVGFVEHEIDRYLEDRIAARDGEAATESESATA